MNDLLLRLRDKGNTVLVVEHKPEMIAIADHAVDLGPGAGRLSPGGLARLQRHAADVLPGHEHVTQRLGHPHLG